MASLVSPRRTLKTTGGTGTLQNQCPSDFVAQCLLDLTFTHEQSLSTPGDAAGTELQAETGRMRTEETGSLAGVRDLADIHALFQQGHQGLP